jgi:uncharacterized membrane protein YidH (DUF202 family)
MTTDRGLQAERTILAWSRTAFATFVNAFFILRYGMTGGSVAISGIGLILLIAAGSIFMFETRRRRIVERKNYLVVSNLPLLLSAITVLVASAGAAASMILLYLTELPFSKP